MSSIQPQTTDQQQNKEPLRHRLRSKSKGPKSTKKKNNINQNGQGSGDQVQVDIPLIQQQELNVKKQQDEVGKINVTTTITRTHPNPLKSQNNNQNGLGNTTVEKQTKLNYFLKKRDDQSLSSRFAPPESQRRKASLENQLKEKQEMIQKLKSQRQINGQKYARLKIESQQSKMIYKEVLEKQLKHSSLLLRQQKAEINPKLGYFKQTSLSGFVEGSYILNARKKLQDLQKLIRQLEEKKRFVRQQEKQRLLFQIDFLTKQKIQAAVQLQNQQAQLKVYKQRLRLADKESICYMAKNDWNTVNDRYLPLQLLGSGGFGEVYKCYDLDKKMHVALKLNCFQPNTSKQNKEQFMKHVERQVKTLRMLNHPNIAKLFDEFMIDNKIAFVMEYCSGPQLNKYLARRQYLQQRQAKNIIKQITFALKYMFQQKQRIIHYDLKPANIIFNQGIVKILDFGLCKNMQTEETKMELTSQGVGTYWYLPPQTFQQCAQISSKVDVWSVGVIFYELLYGRRPYGHGMQQSRIYNQGIILKAIKVQFPQQKKYRVSDEAKQFIRDCLKYNVQQRLDPLQLYNHQYLNK